MMSSADNTARLGWRFALPWALASLICSYASGFLWWLYGYYHWDIVFASSGWQIPDSIHAAVFRLFDIVALQQKLFALAATGLSIVCLRHRPRWIGVAVLIPALLMLFSATMVMT